MKQQPLFLTEFERATLEQLVSYKIAKKQNESDESVALRIEEKLHCPKLIHEAITLTKKWNLKRVKLKLEIFR